MDKYCWNFVSCLLVKTQHNLSLRSRTHMYSCNFSFIQPYIQNFVLFLCRHILAFGRNIVAIDHFAESVALALVVCMFVYNNEPDSLR